MIIKKYTVSGMGAAYIEDIETNQAAYEAHCRDLQTKSRAKLIQHWGAIIFNDWADGYKQQIKNFNLPTRNSGYKAWYERHCNE